MTLDTFTIRLATPDDYDAVVDCVQAAFTKWIDIIGMKPMALTADYHDFINRHVIYVIDGHQTGELAGLVIIYPVNDALYVDTIGVNPAYQEHGLGRRLLTFAEEKAREAGLNKMTLVTNALQLSNQEYYRKNGYAETHRETLEPGRVGVWMAKTLATE
ncbi:MAG: GNAT family N-acetyltransferase [Anaerolineaceae bacterium]|nr:GNAT family N-acetyltransferase [Anaerolineaceae bacterium]